MSKAELIKKITMKKEFSQLPKKDIILAFEKFDKDEYSDEEKFKFTRDLLRKVFSAFTSRKILSLKDKNEEWILKKHLSTRERFSHYEEIYLKLLKNFNKNATVMDLGAGVNGFSYNYFKKIKFNINYIAIESIGQLVSLTNNYFKENKIKAKAIHLSLFELEKIKKIIIKTKKPRIVFLFKVIDSLEMLERDYSKKLISEISPLVDKIVLSFATKSMIKRKKFKVRRNWIINFIKENFKIIDDFEIRDERYIIFKK
tara:strand:+ start:602 stop:1372 length:771 start_codon:yes stop_codon:yes gene_type:complete